MVQFWYPSGPKESNPKLFSYMPEKISATKEYLNKKTGLPLFILNSFLGGIKTYAIPNAKILTNSNEFPVVIFSHGYGCNRDSYATYIEELASYGYVIVGIDHTYDCAITIFPEGKAIFLDEKIVSLAAENKISPKEVAAILNDKISIWVKIFFLF